MPYFKDLKDPRRETKNNQEAAIFAKAFMGIPDLIGWQLYATAYAFGCPAVLLHSLLKWFN